MLEDFLYEAIFVPEGVAAPPKSVINQPELQIYIAGFGKKKDDIALIAEMDHKYTSELIYGFKQLKKLRNKKHL